MVKLTESTIYIRTKSSIENVKKLNLWGCAIDDISVCSKMPLLEVLSLSVNDVECLEGLQNCKNLREIYIRKNKIKSLDQLEYLKDLPHLQTLWLDENPCVGDGGAEYRKKVLKILPNLTKLDDKPVTRSDRQPEIDDSADCDIHLCGSHRSSISDCPMTRSMYIPSTSGPAVGERVMQSQILHFGDTSEEERCFSIDVPGVPIPDPNRSHQMSQSMYGNLCGPLTEEDPTYADGEEEEWNDFSIEENHHPMPLNRGHRMYQSMHEGMMGELRRPQYGRSVSMPRRRATSSTRTNSRSPARELRLSKIMSAVSVLLDELDADALRHVVDEAQRRIKKQH